MTTTGLGMVVRPVLVMGAPGVITEYAQLDRARAELGPRFNEMFDAAGFVNMAWGEAGKNRIFSTEAFAKPADLKTRRPWAWKDDPIFAELMRVVGANPVRMGVPEVYGGLQTRMIDTVPTSSIAAVAMQWYTRLNYVAKDNFAIIVGGSLIKKEKFAELSPADQKVLMDTSERAARALDTLSRRDDDRASQSLVERGMGEVDHSANRAEWDTEAQHARENLGGRVNSKSRLDAVEKVAAAAK